MKGNPARNCLRLPITINRPLRRRFARCVTPGCPWPFRHFPPHRKRLLNCTACRAIRDIRTREFEGSPDIIAATSVEFRSMVREREKMPLKKLLEANSGGAELCPGFFDSGFGSQHVGKPPLNFGVAAR